MAGLKHFTTTFIAASALAVVAFSAPVLGQEAATRYPATGNAILDCAPQAPAPAESCVLRLPPEYERTTPQSEKIGEVEGEFQLLRSGRAGFPDGLEMSATLLLVDLTPGQGGGRRASFAREKELLKEFVDQLPGSEPVAVYGFADTVAIQLDFTTDRGALASAIDGLELNGSNTNISASVREAIRLMDGKEDVILRNIVVVTDGAEEGIGQFDAVTAEAVEAGVSISAIGMFWRPVGAAQNGRGIDFLRSLTQTTLGTTAQVPLPRSSAAQEAVAAFSEKYAKSIERSGLILPTGTAQPSVISLTLSEPVIGDPSRKQDRVIEVTFTPQQVPDDPSTETADAPEALLFGYPPRTIYITGAALAGLLVLAVVFLILRARRGEEEAAPLDFDDGPVTPEPASPSAPAVAYLSFNGSTRREPISASKVNIGRSASNEIVIQDESISRLHAQLHRNRDGGFSVTDMDSLNGTFVNDQKVSGTAPVRTGDVVRFGKVNSTFAVV